MAQTPESPANSSSPGLTGRLGLLALAAVDLYGAAIIVYLGARLAAGDRWWPVALASTFLQWWLLPAFALVPLLLVRRRWRRAVPPVVGGLAWLWLFGGLFLPGPSANCDGGCLTLRVLSYNIGSGLASPETVAQTIRAEDADIVALSEVVEWQAAALDALLAADYPYRVFYPELIHGKALLSRYPIIEESGLFRLHTFNTYLEARLDVEGLPLTVIVAHPPRPAFTASRGYYYPEGTGEDYAELALLAGSGEPLIMAGDFNNTDQSSSYRLLVNAGLHDAFRDAGLGLGSTFPAPGRYWRFAPPFVRIDFILYNDPIEAASAWVGPDAGSDHLPVVAELVMPRSP
jgi:endonuclease/exonuclease/phosphatase (EEP) superfamily protein YafD